MNLSQLHTQEKEVSATSLFKGEIGSATTMQLKQNAELKEHVSKTPALLLCVTGGVLYEEETGIKVEMLPGDYVHIQANVKHWLVARSLSQMILLK